jgi:hypothetical protein
LQLLVRHDARYTEEAVEMLVGLVVKVHERAVGAALAVGGAHVQCPRLDPRKTLDLLVEKELDRRRAYEVLTELGTPRLSDEVLLFTKELGTLRLSELVRTVEVKGETRQGEGRWVELDSIALCARDCVHAPRDGCLHEPRVIV